MNSYEQFSASSTLQPRMRGGNMFLSRIIVQLHMQQTIALSYRQHNNLFQHL